MKALFLRCHRCGNDVAPGQVLCRQCIVRTEVRGGQIRKKRKR